MKSTNGKQTEILKKSMDNAFKNSKESIRSVIQSNTKQFDSAIEANKKTFESISKTLNEKEIDPSIVNSFKTAFGKSIKMSEDVIDSVIDSHSSRINDSIDFTTRFMEIISASDFNKKEGLSNLMELVMENLERSAALSMSNMQKIGTVYNEHLNLVVGFNKKFADRMNTQITAMYNAQPKSMGSFSALDMVTEWWKKDITEKAEA